MLQSQWQAQFPCCPRHPLQLSSLPTIWSSVVTAAVVAEAESTGSCMQVVRRPAVVMATATSSSLTSTVSSHHGKGTRRFLSASSATTAPITTGMDGSPAAGISGSIRISAGSKLQSCRYECPPFRKEGGILMSQSGYWQHGLKQTC